MGFPGTRREGAQGNTEATTGAVVLKGYGDARFVGTTQRSSEVVEKTPGRDLRSALA